MRVGGEAFDEDQNFDIDLDEILMDFEYRVNDMEQKLIEVQAQNEELPSSLEKKKKLISADQIEFLSQTV